jgi:type I restriction enzyme M protein
MAKTTKDQIIKTLWSAADTFRDNIDASNYKDYILSMLFIKYLSDLFKEDVEKLEKEYEGIRLERQIKNLPFVLENESTFDYLYSNRNQDDIGRKISESLTSIESSNATLNGIFRSIDFNSEANLGKKDQKNAILRTLLEDFAVLDLRPSQIETSENEIPSDIIGDAYEYMIGQFATMAGKKAGSFYTPQEVSEVMARIVAPKVGDRIYDPTCGSGSLLIRAAKQSGIKGVQIYGQESNGSAISMARMNMFLHDIQDAQIKWGDTLANPQFLDSDGNLMKFECIVANMPFSLDKWAKGFNPGGEISSDDSKKSKKDTKFQMTAALDRWHRFDIGVPPQSKGDWAFLLHMIHSMSSDGRIAAVAPHGVLFRGASEARIRKAIIDRNLLDAVIGFPENLFYGTSIPASILIFRKNRGEKKDILFIDASKKPVIKDGSKNQLETSTIDEIIDVYNFYKDNNYKEATVDKFSHVATIEEIQKNEYNLNIPRYVDTFEEEEPIDIKLVLKEIKKLEKEKEELDLEIDKYLKELGLLD